MTYVVSSRTLLSACAIAAAIAYAPAGFAHGAGGMGLGAGMAAQPRAMSVQPPVTTSPHPFDPSGHIPGDVTKRTPSPVTQTPSTTPIMGTRIPVTGTHEVPATGNQTPITGTRMPVMETRQVPATGNQTPVLETERPTVGGRFFYPPDTDPVTPPRTSSEAPRNVGGDPTTGTAIVDPPVKPF
jgi:hypothetical protein